DVVVGHGELDGPEGEVGLYLPLGYPLHRDESIGGANAREAIGDEPSGQTNAQSEQKGAGAPAPRCLYQIVHRMHPITATLGAVPRGSAPSRPAPDSST